MRTAIMLTALSLLIALPAHALDWTLGYEGTDDWSHAFLTATQPVGRLGPGELLAWGTASWVRYDAIRGGVTREVSAPGLGGGVLWRYSTRNGALQLGPGYEVRWVDRGFGSETESGLLLRADGHYWLLEGLVATGGATYYDVIDWTSARASVEYELVNDLRVGPEIGYQGNSDINVREIGAIARYPIGEGAAAWLRAGTARTEYANGATRDDPYLSFGISYTFGR